MNEAFETRSEPAQTDAISGELVTEAFDYDDGRQVTVYLPPVPPKAIVFAGDGQMISQWARTLEDPGRASHHDRRRSPFD